MNLPVPFLYANWILSQYQIKHKKELTAMGMNNLIQHIEFEHRHVEREQG